VEQRVLLESAPAVEGEETLIPSMAFEMPADEPQWERVSGEAACEQQHLDNKIHEMM
jgi:hypothetical protein